MNLERSPRSIFLFLGMIIRNDAHVLCISYYAGFESSKAYVSKYWHQLIVHADTWQSWPTQDLWETSIPSMWFSIRCGAGANADEETSHMASRFKS
ncbi:hypothetical protein FPSE_09815 [Fusarium pseudograminearum CS3096]|uniref:Uncharacterized protein n=1 Tax=Fusarium pseudograminearum (strain CS3096) TaxID=1028729 RepID=K3VY37_FUSPC|nr:hypothetical protein FPSE_09815 [Fusarium pseudograminearum CS3096]EKJ69970.1 hypothetical protein FPSE_09815 [Fusarium pseudograminearum CS3096]